MKQKDLKLNVAYSVFHFGYWVDYLIISSFGAVLLAGRGFRASEIGYVTTIGAVLTILLQSALSSLADRSEKITVKRILFGLMLGGAVITLILWLVPGAYAVSFIGMFTALSLVNTLQPMMTSLCLQYNAAGRDVNFGVARSVGSLGYALAGFAMGRITEALGTEAILPIYSGIFVALLVLLSFMRKPGKPAPSTAGKSQTDDGAPSGFVQFFRRYRRYDVFLLSVMLLFFMQMITNTYMIYFVEYFGGGKAEMGLVLSVCAFAEMPAVALGVSLLKRFRAETLLRVGSLGGLTKFTAMLFIPNVRWLIGIQLLQFFYSGLYMVASVYYADSIVGRKDSVKAQGILAVGVTGVSGIAANLIGGYMLEHTTVRAIMIVGACASLLCAALMFLATSKRLFQAKEESL